MNCARARARSWRALLARAAWPSGTIMDTTPVRMFFKGLRRFVPELTFAEVRRDEEIEGGDSVIPRGATPLAGHAEPAHAASSEIARGDIDDVDAERRVVPSSVIPAAWNASAIARLLAAAPPRVHRCCERNCATSKRSTKRRLRRYLRVGKLHVRSRVSIDAAWTTTFAQLARNTNSGKTR